ncbi:MFS transporter [Arthrobacter sp. ISL-72]|uniref:MFS transporter n=1 Tax=Arthrobacter sp. ISL-72 TaxID=2819114 RepID=UPI002035A107|nr:MFS transporter [Arthrobacter sp. ISL-72]
MAIFGGSVLAFIIGGAVTNVLSDSAVAEWGWRIPFLFGALLAPAALYMRRGMAESEVFDGDQEEQAENTVTSLDREKVTRSILMMIGMTAGITAAHYTWTSYASTYAITRQGMDAEGAYWVTVFAQLIALVSLPSWGRLSDKIGRRPVLVVFAGAMIVAQIPLMSLINDQPWTLFVASTLALLIVAAAGALLASILSEAFPTRVRTQGIGFAYSFSVALFGGTAPYLNALFNSWELGWLSNVYIMVLCGLTGIVVFKLRETKGIDLKDA